MTVRLVVYRVNIIMVEVIEELWIEIISISRNEKISGLTFIFLAWWRYICMYMRYLTKSNVNMKHSDRNREEHLTFIPKK